MLSCSTTNGASVTQSAWITVTLLEGIKKSNDALHSQHNPHSRSTAYFFRTTVHCTSTQQSLVKVREHRQAGSYARSISPYTVPTLSHLDLKRSTLLPNMTRPSGSPIIDRQMLDTWQAMLFDAATNSRYKNGAFEDLIQRDTPALQAVDTCLDSALLSKRERAIFEKIRLLIGDVTNGQSEDAHRGLRQKFVKMVSEDTNLRTSRPYSNQWEAASDGVHWKLVETGVKQSASRVLW